MMRIGAVAGELLGIVTVSIATVSGGVAEQRRHGWPRLALRMEFGRHLG